MSVKKGEVRVKNHFVPEGYLKNWSGSDGKIFTYKTLVQHEKVHYWRSYHPSSIAYHKHLYTMQIAGDENDDLERWFDNEFESPALPIVEKVISNRKLSSKEWEILIKFLAAQDVRTPTRLIEHIRRISEILPETLNDVMSNLPKKLSGISEINYESSKPEYFKYFPLKIDKSIQVGASHGTLKATTYAGRSTWFFSIRHLLEHTAKVLHSYKWKIIRPHPGSFWPTSDNPVIKLNCYENGMYDLKGGWGVKNGVILFPIGPEHAMFIQIGENLLKREYTCTELETLIFKKFIFENADRMVFANNADNDVLLFRQRVVDANQVKIEKSQFSDWVNENNRLENEFNKSDVRTP
ncbi:DUF4238 domain-containing protein [Cellvibrio sp. KY-YJ-3]|uniref:DUF4238 domain-containing protein n=1 Tax=Cellvibrio sp. KY-YJ-3 TaxID=454662 RepID=UPI0012475D27|nr:DUF4238 domain-containing protein [Cellvibrio sp. KY-YJ-3]QEY11541.1 DUF4238 domain-containing protein [Cellvibrio sp. KY-YJ-3]